MIEWWSEIEHGIIECLASGGPLSPRELGRRVGLSEGEAIAFVHTAGAGGD
jgi:DNA-binding Lrp family transcriptional regulator